MSRSTIAVTSTSWTAPTRACTSSSSRARRARSRDCRRPNERKVARALLRARAIGSGADHAQVRGLGCHQAAIDIEILLHHAAGGEALLEPFADALARELVDAPDRRDGAGLVLDDVAGQPVLDHLRDGARMEPDDRCPTGHRLDHDEPKGLPPIDRKQESEGPAQEGRLR